MSTIASAQGSAAGYGQGGGFGGGMGGGMGGAGGGSFGAGIAPQTHPEDDPGDDGKLYETRTAILTPGDRVEYKLKVQKGETLFAGASSDAFDPALAVEDASGKVLAKNDDREEGDQAPFLAVRFPEAGTYTFKVLSYRQASGGKFTLKMRTFVAEDVPLGRSVHDAQNARYQERRLVLRIQGKKGKVYDLRQEPAGVNGGVPQIIRVIGPNGVERTDLERIATNDGSPVFLALTDGDYYAEYRYYGSVRFQSDLREVPVLSGGVDDEKTLHLGPGDLAIVEFPVEPMQIVRTTFIAPAAGYRIAAPAGERGNDVQVDTAFGYDPSWTWFRLENGSSADVVRIFRGSGTARVAIRSTGRTDQQVVLRNSTKLPVWNSGDPLKDHLGIGEVRLFLLTAKKSDLMRLSATSPNFQPRLDIFRLDGELANMLPTRSKTLVADDLYFPDAGTFLIRLSCNGYGGSGDYTLRRDTPKPSPYRLSSAETLTLDGTNFGLYSVELEAGKRYQLLTDDAATPLRVDLLDEDGTFLQSQAVRFEKTTVQYFVPTRSGRHRLWLRGSPGTYHFKLEPHAQPVIG
jgi:hypothetical protein